MTLAEKVGQMTQVEKNSITPDQVAEFSIGSVLSGGGGNPTPNTASDWRAMVESFLAGALRSRLRIPLLYGTDAVHGHSNVVGATIFPHNIGLGAAGDPDLVEAVYRAAALETTATGSLWMFAPTLAVALDPRWGRTYEAFGDDPELVSELGTAAVRGIIGPDRTASGAALATIKHFVGDGGTGWGSVRPAPWIDFWDEWSENWKIDQGDTEIDEATLRRVHMAPYPPGIAAGALSAMASYSSWNGAKLHGHKYLLTDVLKGELGFEGFVVSDWLGLAQLAEDPYDQVVAGINAGIDMVMVPMEFESFIESLIKAVEAGDVSLDRVDDAVRRILLVKHAIALFEPQRRPKPSLEVVGCDAHRALAREAVAKSAVLLKNRSDALPLDGESVLVAGLGAHDIGTQCGGWTIDWQGSAGPITPGTTLVEALEQSGMGIAYTLDGQLATDEQFGTGVVVVGEAPYTEGFGDTERLELSDADVELVARIRERVATLVLVVISGRPLVLNQVEASCDAIVAAWLPGTEGAGLADVLVGDVPFTGKLPRRWPRSADHVVDPAGDWTTDWDRGFGLRTVGVDPSRNRGTIEAGKSDRP
ncbi:MAG: glycoside hydrolase family 3 protein [Acidimicrobiales bacterium]